MIRVAHITYPDKLAVFIETLFKYRNPAKFEYALAWPLAGNPAGDKIRHTGALPWYTAIEWADIVNLHGVATDPSLVYTMMQFLGKPCVATLHWASVMPQAPAVTICTADTTYQIQPDKRRFVAIPNGIDLARFTPRPKEPRQEVIMTRVSRSDKCALYFWPAMKQVLARYPQARLWIVGNDAHYGLSSDQVTFWGPRADVPDILAQSDIFVNAPYPHEGSKDLSVMEASAMGVPCVVADTNATRDSIFEGQNGFLVPFGDGQALAQKVGLLVADAGRRQRMSQAAIELARQHFDMSRIVPRYEAVYEAVLEAWRGSSDEWRVTSDECRVTRHSAPVTQEDAEVAALKQHVHQAMREILAEQQALPFPRPIPATPGPTLLEAALGRPAGAEDGRGNGHLSLAPPQLLSRFQEMTGEALTEGALLERLFRERRQETLQALYPLMSTFGRELGIA